VRSPVIASGGVGQLCDLERLAELPIAGCLVGRALYEGRFTLTEAIRLACQIPPAGREARTDGLDHHVPASDPF